ncbi:MAG: hypothetical protein IKL55_02745 [Clostridia bacterium]|nr:hypothetical protein [Clostridia bacterium]
MKSKFTINELVVKIPGSKLPKVLNLSDLDDHTQSAILNAYNASTIYAPNLTATKSEKLSAAMSRNIAEFKKLLSTLESPSGRNIANAFCQAFEFDSINTPNIVRLAQTIADTNCRYVDLDVLLSILIYDHKIKISAAELYAEFQGWKYYQMIKNSVGGVSVVKFMRFYIGLVEII